MKKALLLLPLFLSFIAVQAQTDGMSIGTNATPDEMLDVNGAIRIGTDFTNSPTAAPLGGIGTIRFRSGNFEGYTSSGWVLLSSAGTDDQDLTAATLSAANVLSLSIEDGTGITVDLSALDQSAHVTADNDLDATNEFQDLSLNTSTNILSLTDDATTVDLSPYLDNTDSQLITLTSDVTGSGTGSFATTIGNNKVTNPKLADMDASRIKGRETGTGDPEDLTPAQVKNILGLTNATTGIGHPNKVAFWTGASTLDDNAILHWDNANARLGIGDSVPEAFT